MRAARSLHGMDTAKIRADFAARMHVLCDELGIPRGHGRNTALAKAFDVTPNAARKWLLGHAYPELAMAVALCDRAGVNVNWLLQGSPPMRGERVDPRALALATAIDALPSEPRDELLAFLRFQLVRHEGWFTAEQVANYLVDLEATKSRERNAQNAGQPTPATAGRQAQETTAYALPRKDQRAA